MVVLIFPKHLTNFISGTFYYMKYYGYHKLRGLVFAPIIINRHSYLTNQNQVMAIAPVFSDGIFFISCRGNKYCMFTVRNTNVYKFVNFAGLYFRYLQHFTTRLCKFTDALAAMKDFFILPAWVKI